MGTLLQLAVLTLLCPFAWWLIPVPGEYFLGEGSRMLRVSLFLA